MSIRSTIAAIVQEGGEPDQVARTICGYLSCECGLDNGNGWYDDDPDMAENNGLANAEEAWLARTGKL